MRLRLDQPKQVRKVRKRKARACLMFILPPNNIELAGGVPEPRAGAAGTADGRAQVVQAMA